MDCHNFRAQVPGTMIFRFAVAKRLLEFQIFMVRLSNATTNACNALMSNRTATIWHRPNSANPIHGLEIKGCFSSVDLFHLFFVFLPRNVYSPRNSPTAENSSHLKSYEILYFQLQRSRKVLVNRFLENSPECRRIRYIPTRLLCSASAV